MKSILACLLTCMLSLPVFAAASVDINTASAEEIAAALNGIGLSKAEEIVRYREQNGNFVHIDELVNVKGVGIRTIDKNRDLIVITDVQAQTQE